MSSVFENSPPNKNPLGRSRERCLTHSERGWNSMKQAGQFFMHFKVRGLKRSTETPRARTSPRVESFLLSFELGSVTARLSKCEQFPTGAKKKKKNKFIIRGGGRVSRT